MTPRDRTRIVERRAKRIMATTLAPAATAIALAATTLARAETVVFQAGGPNGATSDTWIAQAQPGTSHGGLSTVEWDGSDGGGANHALVRFDAIFGTGTGQIAPSDEITAATLEYHVVNVGSEGIVNEVRVDWAEGVTWNTFGAAPGVQPDDYGTEVGAAVGNSGWRSVDVRASLVKWAQDPASNRGWIIRPTGSDGVEFTSSEGASSSRVRLVVVVNEGDPPLAVVRGPYLQRGTPSGAVVRWRTNTPTDTRIVYGPAPDDLTMSQTDPAITTEHEITLSGLTPNTTSYYAVGTSRALLAGGDEDHRFVTSPERTADAPARIWVIGDSGTADANAAAVYDAYRTSTGGARTDLWLMLGDNAYTDGTDAEYQAAVFDMYPDLLARTFLWTTIGNHDGHSADSDTETGPYYDAFTLPRAGEAGGLASGTEAYYSFDYGHIHFVCLDSYETDTSMDGAMMMWLENDLADTLADWVIAFWHHPPYTKGSHDSDTEGRLIDMRERALPILEAAGVDLVLCGHSHSYERSFLLDGHYGPSGTLAPEMLIDAGDGREDGDGAYDKGDGGPNAGAVYVVAGSSGKTGGGSLDHPAMFIALNQLGSVILEVDGGRLDATFLRADGTTPDHFTLVKHLGCAEDL
ncbi:MAG: metallophosphoesterase family protein, partial [Phycisphaerales bacterium]|nr:metallophosphoesterase family protein [Phycisphaerales bacterium]